MSIFKYIKKMKSSVITPKNSAYHNYIDISKKGGGLIEYYLSTNEGAKIEDIEKMIEEKFSSLT